MAGTRALLRKKVEENWTEKHRNVARKIFLEGGWTQKRLFDIGWSDLRQCQSVPGAGRHRKAQAVPLSRMALNQAGNPTGLEEVGAKGQNVKEKSGSGKGASPRTLSQ